MQAVFVPGGNTDMGCVEPLLVGDDGDNVAVVDGVAENCRIGNLALRNITVTLAVHTLFQFSDSRFPFRMSLKHLIARNMRTHPVDVHGLNSRERRIGRNILHDSLALVCIHPNREIMLALHIGNLSAHITHIPEMFAESRERSLVLLGAQGERRNHLYVCGAVQLTGVHDEHLFLRPVQRAAHIRNARHLLAEPEHPTGWFHLHRPCLLQQSYNPQTVLPLINHIHPGFSRNSQHASQHDSCHFRKYFHLFSFIC